MIEKYYDIGKKLFPLNRSITGKDTLKTLKIISKNFKNFKIKSIKSGTKVFDWKIPPEWNVKDAYILDKHNKKIVDFKLNNLHLVGYSKHVRLILTKEKLLRKLYSLKNNPNAIPYVTSYYKKNWGFCVTENFKKKLINKYQSFDKFKIIINSKFNKDGLLNYGEFLIKGKVEKEILISTYICHPSMANNELSGPIVSMSLISHFKKLNNYYSMRFLFIPETIGSIAYISKNLKRLKKKVFCGFNISCIGDEKNHSYILSKYKNSPSDEALLLAYKKLKIKKITEFSFLERGSDERQFNSYGVDLKITSVSRTKYGEFKEYHTSLDNFDLVTKKGLREGYNVVKKAIEIIHKKDFPRSKILCEPFFTKRKLYPTLSRANHKNIKATNLLDFLQYSDGNNSLEKISLLIKVDIKRVRKIFKNLKKYNLIY